MHRELIVTLCLLLASAVTAAAQEAGAVVPAAPAAEAAASSDPEARSVKGMAVLGNNEAPMSLFIVPWKTSELGATTTLKRTLDERDVPVDRDVFQRELAFYQVSVGRGGETPETER